MLKFKSVNLLNGENVKDEVREGWQISGLEEGFLSLNCTVGEKKFYISANRALADKLKSMSNDDINKSLNVETKTVLTDAVAQNLKIIPLYKNCIFDEMNEKDIEKGDQFHCVYIKSQVDIGTIQFKNCSLVTPIISDTNSNRETYTMAFVIRTEKGKDYSLKVFTMDKTVCIITETGEDYQKVNHEIKRPMISLHGPKYIVIPNKAYFTNDNVKNTKEGMISVKANDVINKNNIIRVNRKRAEFVYGLDLTCEEIIAIKTRLGILPKQNIKRSKHNRTNNIIKSDLAVSEPIIENKPERHNRQKYNNKKGSINKNRKNKKSYKK